MTDALSTWLARYRADPDGFSKAQGDPVVWVEEPPADEPEGDEERSLHTATGVRAVAECGQPRIFVVKKVKDNAFQRGVTVGRTPNNDVVIDDASVSRFHAWFQRDAAGWALVDASSKNGTYVSVRRLGPKKPQPLRGGEKLRFGSVDAWFLTPQQLVDRLKRRLGEPRHPC